MSYQFTFPYTKKEIPPKGDFPARVRYVPLLKTFLSYNKKLSLIFPSIVDSGADYCIFPANIAEDVGLDIEKGKKLPMHGIGGEDLIYFHKVKVSVDIEDATWQFDCPVGFSRGMSLKGVGYLGRSGFFDLFKMVSFMEEDHKVVLTTEGDKPSTFKQGGPLF